MSEGLLAFVGSVTSWLDEAGVPYMVAGSFASTLDGRPRSTQDVDIVVDATAESMKAFVANVPAERAYVDLRTAGRCSDARHVQLDDVAGVIAAGGDGLDLGYIEKWVTELGVEDGWATVKGTE